jgi:hypothetical protein
MRRPTLLLVVLLLAAGCDTGYGGFLDTVPVTDQHLDRPVDVVLGIDGMSRAAFTEARARGAFRSFAVSELVTFFPGVSDYSWMRILRAGQLPGYEIQYYDPEANVLHNSGIAGVAEHPLRGGVADPFPSYGRFDFLGDGDLWDLKGYTNPEAALPDTLDALFNTLATRGRGQPTFLGYLMNVDVVSHHGGFQHAVAMLMEIDRRIQDFQARHPDRFTFTLIADHGNAHQKAELVDPRELLRDVGVTPVEALDDPSALEAIPIVHVRVNFVSVHTHPARVAEVATRASNHRWVDLVAAPLPAGDRPRFAVFHKGATYAFTRDSAGTVIVEDAPAWRALGIELPADRTGVARLTDAQAFDATIGGPYPDLFHRVTTAFTDPTVKWPPSLILSLRDDVASFGFHLPGTGDALAVDGFHGALSRDSTMSVVASQSHALPAAVRADELYDLLPALRAGR